MVQAVKHHLAAVAGLAVVGVLTTLGVKAYLPGVLGVRAFGYGALVLLGVTLMIGPLARVWPRWFARLLAYRRATGIWSAISGGVHFLYVLQMVGAEPYRRTLLTLFVDRLSFTFPNGQTQTQLMWNPWNDLNAQLHPLAWTGAIALAILLIIALVSNDRVQRFLGHAAWKLMQQQAYTAFLFVTLHVLLMRFGNKLKGNPPLLGWAPWLLLAVALLQATGFIYTIWKQNKRRAGA